MKKWSHPIGDLHKQKILQIIAKSGLDGLYQHEITKKSGLTRQSNSKILKKLISEGKIHTLAGLYFIKDDNYQFDFIFYFPAFIESFLDKMTENKDNLSELVDHPPNMIFDNLQEKCIFEFVNAIGALITYILIETKRPYENNVDYEKIIQIINLFFKDISLKDIFYRFGYFFGNTRHNKPYDKMSKEDFDKVTEGFRKVYPKLYTNLENGWQEHCNSVLQFKPRRDKFKNCHHIWREHHAYKLGKKYKQCILCSYRKVIK